MTLDPLEQWLRTAHPNPDRIGCPSSSILRDLAERRLPIEHPVVAHIDSCSPCYQEFAQMRDARRLADKAKRRRFVATLCVAAACGLVIAAGSLWIYRQLHTRPHAPLVVEGNRRTTPIKPVEIPGILNYQGISVRRGADSQPSAQTGEQIVSRSVRELAIVLPTGREAGPYVVEVRPPAGTGKPLVTYTGMASIDAEGITTLRTQVDLTSLTAGTYTLAWHVVGSDFTQSGTFVLR